MSESRYTDLNDAALRQAIGWKLEQIEALQAQLWAWRVELGRRTLESVAGA